MMNSFDGDFSYWLPPMEIFSRATESMPQCSQLYQKLDSEVSNLKPLINSCQQYTLIKNMINENELIVKVKEACQKSGEKWAVEFLEWVNKTATAGNILDPDSASKALSTCFDRTFFNSFGLQMLATTACSLFESILAWKIVHNFQIPNHKTSLETTERKLNDCGKILGPIVGLDVLTIVEMQKLERVRELLSDAKDMIEFIANDLKNKINEAKCSTQNNYYSAAMNFLKALVNGFVSYQMVTKIGIDSSATCQACLSTLIQTGITIGDYVHAGKANDFVSILENTLKAITQYENLYGRMAEQFKEKFNNVVTIKTIAEYD